MQEGGYGTSYGGGGGGYNSMGTSYPYGGGGGYGGYGGGGGGYNYTYNPYGGGGGGSDRSHTDSDYDEESHLVRGGAGGRDEQDNSGDRYSAFVNAQREDEDDDDRGRGHASMTESTPFFPASTVPQGGVYGLTYADLETQDQYGLYNAAVKVVTRKEVPARIKTICNMAGIATGATVAPLAFSLESELFIGSLNLVLVLIPLFYVVAKNMEVDLQNKDLKEEILALCQKLGIPAKTPGESRQTLVNIIVTVISLGMAMAAFFILYYGNNVHNQIIATAITSSAIVFSGVTKMLSARALRKHQNELLDIKADLKMLEKQNEVTQTAIQMEEKNRRLKVELVKIKNMPKQQLEESVRNLEEQNRALMRELERARTIVQARVTNAGMPSQGGGGVLEKIKKKKKKKSTSKKSKK